MHRINLILISETKAHQGMKIRSTYFRGSAGAYSLPFLCKINNRRTIRLKVR